MRWQIVGNGLFCPSAVCPKPGEITLFARRATGEIVCARFEGSGWGELQSLGVPIVQRNGLGPVPADWQLTACNGESGRIEIFLCSPDGELLHIAGAGNEWSSVECMGAPAAMIAGIAVPLALGGPPAACSRGANRIHVFVVGQHGELLTTSRNGAEWSDFEALGTPTLQVGENQQPVPISGPLAVCCCGSERMAVFVRGSLGDLLLKWWDGTHWSAFTSLGWPQVPDEIYPAVTYSAPLTGPPAACSWGPKRLDVFARGPGGALFHKWWDGHSWGTFECLGMPTTGGSDPQRIPLIGALAACTWGENRWDIFARTVDGNLYHSWWEGS